MRIDRGTSTKRNTMLSIMSIKVVLLVLLTLAFFDSNPDCTYYVQHYHIHIHILCILSCIYMCIARHTETLTLWAFLSAIIKYPLNMVTRIQGRHCTRITLNLQILCWYQIRLIEKVWFHTRRNSWNIYLELATSPNLTAGPHKL